MHEDVLQNDLRELLQALGMYDGAQPASPHQVFQKALVELRQRFDGLRQCAADLRRNSGGEDDYDYARAGFIAGQIERFVPVICLGCANDWDRSADGTSHDTGSRIVNCTAFRRCADCPSRYVNGGCSHCDEGQGLTTSAFSEYDGGTP